MKKLRNNRGLGIIEFALIVLIIVTTICLVWITVSKLTAQAESTETRTAGVVNMIVPSYVAMAESYEANLKAEAQAKYEAELMALEEYLLNLPEHSYYKIGDSKLQECYQDYLWDTMKVYGIATEENFKILLAQLYCESNYQIDLIDNQDYGLAQINKSVHSYMRKQLGIPNINGAYDFLDPFTSIDCCVYLMADGIKKYGVEGALVRYNYGHINKSHSSPYSRKVLKTVWKLEEVE